MMYIVFIINRIHHLMNKFKILIFAYNSDQMMYLLSVDTFRVWHDTISSCNFKHNLRL